MKGNLVPSLFHPVSWEEPDKDEVPWIPGWTQANE